MIKINVTMLEQFRRWKYTEFDDFEREFEAELRLLAAIDGVPFEPTLQMKYGTAFDAIIEKPERYSSGDEYTYRFDDGLVVSFPAIYVQAAKSRLDWQYKGVWQVRGSKLYDINGLMVEVVGRADILYADMVIDNKTTWSGFNYDGYAESAQWRFYLEIFEGERFWYNVFEMRDKAAGIEMVDIHQFSFLRYDELHVDNHSLVADFVRYLEIKSRVEMLAV